MTDESMSYIEALTKIKELKEAVNKIKDDLQTEINNNTNSYGIPNEYAYCYEYVLNVIIEKHTEGLV